MGHFDYFEISQKKYIKNWYVSMLFVSISNPVQYMVCTTCHTRVLNTQM